MGFKDERFPTSISYGSQGGPAYYSQIIRSDSGVDEVVSRYDGARRKYDVGFGVKTLDDCASLQDHFMVMEGAANSFPYKDFLDYTTAANHRDVPTNVDQALVPSVGDGVTTEFQLVTRYTFGGQTKVRNIELPVTGTTVIALDTVDQPSGWTVGRTTGKVTFTTPPGVGVAVTGGCEFDTLVRYSEETDGGMIMSIDSFDEGSAPNIMLLEVFGGATHSEEMYRGGFRNLGNVSDNLTLSIADGRAQRINPLAAINATLPDSAGVDPGRNILTIINASPTFAITVKDHLAATVGTIGASSGADIVLLVDTGGALVWGMIG